MIGAIKRRWKSNKKCADKDKEKVVTPLPSFPTSTSSPRSRKGTLPPVDFIHVNSGRIELHPGAVEKEVLWGQRHLHYETRHSWCGPQQGIQNQDSSKQKKLEKQATEQQLIDRIAELEKLTKEMPQIQPVVNQLKEDLTQSISRQEHLAADLDTLHLRVHTLETHNKALANIILPTLMRLTKEKSQSQSIAATPPTPQKLASTPEPRKTPSSLKHISKSSPTTPVKTKTMKKPDSLDISLQNSPKITPKVECRIPRILSATKGSTTHPPKTSSSANQVSRPKSKLPVRKSSSIGQGPLSSKINNSPLPKSSLAITKAAAAISGCEIPNTGPDQAQSLPPKDEGYSTMSNGAIDSQEPPISLPIVVNPTATFTRPKKVQEPQKSGYATTSSSGSGTWTKSKAKTKTSPRKSPKLINVPLPSSSSTSDDKSRTFATATMLQPASITTTKENVRIVRGMPHEIRFSSESSQQDVSGPVLWEDSDDSDILFLPIEVSSGSESTLVPYPYSRSSYTTTSTLTSNGTTAPEEDSSRTTTPIPKLKQDPSWDSATDEQDLVQRWMRLEDTRNEDGTWGEEQWSWDWDGIIHSKEKDSSSSGTWGKKKSEEEKSLDSSTWTRSSKGSHQLNPDTISLSLSEEHPATPTPTTTELDFTAAFYRLTSSGTEDKINQTETCSSSDNLVVAPSSDSTDLFLQCKNCLEKMSKLISLQENSGTEDEGGTKPKKSYSEQVSQILLMQMQLNKEGSSSKWRPMDLRSPQGHLGHQNFVLMSSTESEGLVSPSME